MLVVGDESVGGHGECRYDLGAGEAGGGAAQ